MKLVAGQVRLGVRVPDQGGLGHGDLIHPEAAGSRARTAAIACGDGHVQAVHAGLEARPHGDAAAGAHGCAVEVPGPQDLSAVRRHRGGDAHGSAFIDLGRLAAQAHRDRVGHLGGDADLQVPGRVVDLGEIEGPVGGLLMQDPGHDHRSHGQLVAARQLVVQLDHQGVVAGRDVTPGAYRPSRCGDRELEDEDVSVTGDELPPHHRVLRVRLRPGHGQIEGAVTLQGPEHGAEGHGDPGADADHLLAAADQDAVRIEGLHAHGPVPEAKPRNGERRGLGCFGKALLLRPAAGDPVLRGGHVQVRDQGLGGQGSNVDDQGPRHVLPVFDGAVAHRVRAEHQRDRAEYQNGP